jgi:short-subunit dehydrogenase
MPETRTALVTGATSGIGRPAALKLARDGFQVLVRRRDADRGAVVVKEIESVGGNAEFLAADLTGLTDVGAIDQLAAAAGDVDVLVNNAGFSWFGPGPGADLDPDTYDALFDANVRSTYCLTAALAPKMAQRGHGTVINLGSVVGQNGLAGSAAYSATKATLASLTRSPTDTPTDRHLHP